MDETNVALSHIVAFPSHIFYRGFHDRLHRGDLLWKTGGKTDEIGTGSHALWRGIYRQTGTHPAHIAA